MIPLPLLFSNVNWKRVVGAGAAAVIIVLILYVRLQRIALAQAEVVYQNPRTVQQARVVRVQGPVRIITKIVRTPGREEITTDETRAPVTVVRDSIHLSEPVLPPAPRLDRWLAGARAEPFHYTERQAWAAYGGYSFRNRLDLCAGVSGRGRAEVLVLLRF